LVIPRTAVFDGKGGKSGNLQAWNLFLSVGFCGRKNQQFWVLCVLWKFSLRRELEIAVVITASVPFEKSDLRAILAGCHGLGGDSRKKHWVSRIWPSAPLSKLGFPFFPEPPQGWRGRKGKPQGGGGSPF
jgi:hypothetical protein